LKVEGLGGEIKMAATPADKVKNQKIIFAAALGVALIWVYWNYFYKPINKDVKTLREDLVNKRRQLETTRQAAQEYEYMEAELEVLKIEASVLEKKLPYKKDLPTLIKDITRSIERHRLSVQTFIPAKEAQKAYFSEFPMFLQVTGTYHNLAAFLAEVGQYERIINTTDVSLTPLATSKTQLNTASANFKLVTYTGK
jgi:type IV pilus assembly protein PilO